MTQDLPQELLNRLDAIAAKFGTTVEYLWPELVRYTWARALVWILAAALLLLLGPLMVRWGASQLNEAEQLKTKRGLTGPTEREEAVEGVGWAILVLGSLSVAVAIVMAGVNLAKLLAPAGATLNSLLGIR